MISLHLKGLAGFYVPWMASVAAAAMEPAGPMLTVRFDGMTVPLVQVLLAAAGVLMARPLAPKRERAIGIGRFILVTAIMLIVAVTWAAQSQPGPLFAFVVAIGLGFSGYSLIELAGREIENFIKGIFGAATGALRGKDSGTDA